MLARLVLGLLSALIGVSLWSWASSAQSFNDYAILDDEQRMFIQLMLVWTGDYNGFVDGVFGRGTYNAVLGFQSRHGYRRDGFLDVEELRVLFDEGGSAIRRTGFDVVEDGATGLTVGIPASLVRRLSSTARGTTWASADDSIRIETVLLRDAQYTLASLYDRLQFLPNRVIEYARFKEDWFVINGVEGNRRFYAMFASSWGVIRGFSVSWNLSHQRTMSRVATAMASVFGHSTAPPMEVARAPDPPVRPGMGGVDVAVPSAPLEQSGSGFVIARGSWIVTNAHVVEGCSLVYVGAYGSATDITRDTTNDLALLRLPGVTTLVPLKLAPLGVPLGAHVLAFGFPLQEILAESLNVTDGIVSSTAGIRNDSRFLQTTVAVQPGNSGGPLVDDRGHVVGIVTAKLSTLAMLEAVGDVPDSVNFAIRGEVLSAFLAAQGVAVEAGSPTDPTRSVADIAADAQSSVVALRCSPGD